jgi:hypothetical protein
MKLISVYGRLSGKKPCRPTLYLIMRFTKHVIDSFIAFPQFSADQNPISEFQFFKMIFDAGKIFVIKLSFEHLEKRCKTV